MKTEKEEEEKLGQTAQEWRNGLFLTALGCLFWTVFSASFLDGQGVWECINAGAIFYIAHLILPEKINQLLKKCGKKNEKNHNETD